jgi:hypothetical protein
MALFLLCPNLGWIQGQFNFTELSLRYPGTPVPGRGGGDGDCHEYDPGIVEDTQAAWGGV